MLAVRESGRWLILDNRWAALADSSEARHLTPLFALGHEGVSLFAAPYEVRLPQDSSGPAGTIYDASRG